MTETIFIIEDDVILQRTYTLLFRHAGFQIIGNAENGEEAIHLFQSLPTKADIILVDYRMPIKDGLQTTKELLEINKDLNIIFASADDSIKDEALSLGAKAFLEKPFPFKVLINKIKTILKN